MKRCPECHESFADEQKFCDIHGAPLLDETVLLREALTHSTGGQGLSGANSTIATIIIGVLVGVALCLLVYATLLTPLRPARLAGEEDRGSGRQLASTRSNQMVMGSGVEARPSPSLTEATPAPTEDVAQSAASPLPAATGSPEVAAAALNNGPISTGGRRAVESVHPVIKMKDGSSGEADAAWEDPQGIWYRRGGLVSFVERDKVEKITEPTQPAAAAEVPKR